MEKQSVRSAIPGVLGISTLILASSVSQNFSWATQSLPQSQQLTQSLRKALNEARTLEEYREHPGHPENLLHSLIDSSANLLDTCRVLGELELSSLVEMEEALSHEQDLPCQESLLSSISHHWETENKKSQLRTLRTRLSSTLNPPSLPKTEAIEIDATLKEVFFKGPLKNGQIALTFDDGPHPTRTRRILDILAARGVKATFFSLGKQATALPDLVQSAAKEGHSVGSHSKTHALLTQLSLEKGKAEIRGGHDAVTEAMKPFESAPFFRFPYGGKNIPLQSYAKSQNLSTFFWNIDTLDWKYKDPKFLIGYIKKLIDQEKGGILLMHDIQEQTVIVLPELLDYMAEKGITPIVFLPKRQ